MRQNPFTEEEQSAHERVIAELAEGDIDGLLDLASDDFKALDNIDAALPGIMDIAMAHPIDPQLVYGEDRVSEDEAATPIQYGVWESDYGDEILVIEVATENKGACCLLRHVKLTSFSESPSRQNDWDYPPLTPGRVIIGFLILALPIFCSVSALICALDKGQKRRWLWVPFCLLGLWGISYNWTTGGLGLNFFSMNGSNVSFSIIKFQLLGVGVGRTSLFMPWIINIGLPLGAIFYWIKRRKRPSPAETFPD